MAEGIAEISNVRLNAHARRVTAVAILFLLLILCVLALVRILPFGKGAFLALSSWRFT